MRASVIEIKRDISEKHKSLLFGKQYRPMLDGHKSIFRPNETRPDQEEERPAKALKALEVFQEKLKLSENQNKNGVFLEKFIISYNNQFKSIWDILIMLMVIYSSISSAYLLAFDVDSSLYPALDGFNTFVEVLFALDIIFTFLQEYKDPQTFEYVRELKLIALNYLKHWFIIDFLAVFPFQAFSNITIFRLLRILRLPRFLRFVNAARFDKLIRSLLQNANRQKRMNYLYASKYVYKVVRLILIATVLTYFLGCLWYFIITFDPFHEGVTGFFAKYELEEISLPRRLVLCCYFALTTLSTVGYGDLTPQSNPERIFGIVIMIFGIAFFSYIMGNFNDVLTNYDKQMGIVDKSADLQVWITSLTKFTNNQALPRELVQKIDEHFKYVWKNDRLSSLTPDDPYLKQMPKPMKYKLIQFLFDEVLSTFRGFLLTTEFRDSFFYYELAFEMLPRKYDPKEIILKQGEPVHEIYLIKEGSVFIYFEHEGKQIGKYFGKGYFFGNYNVFRNVPAEFNYQAIKGTENAQSTKVLAIPKANLLKILAKYPDIFARMADNSKRNSNTLKELMKHELKSALAQQNGKESSYTEVENIFKQCVTDKVKQSQALLKETARKNQGSDVPNSPGIPKGNGPDGILQNVTLTPHNSNSPDPAVDFRKNIAKDLIEITNKLQKVRDKLAMREKNNNEI